MHFSIHFTALFLSAGGAIAQSACSSGIQGFLAPLASAPAVQSFCSSKYPVTTSTSTVTQSNTITVPGQTITTTIIYAAATVVDDVTSISYYKRAPPSAPPVTTPSARTTPAMRDFELPLVIAQASAVVSTFCSCAEAHPTITITSTTNITVTAPPTTTTVSQPSTVIVTSTSIVAEPQPTACSASQLAYCNNNFGCAYCGYVVGTGIVHCWQTATNNQFDPSVNSCNVDTDCSPAEGNLCIYTNNGANKQCYYGGSCGAPPSMKRSIEQVFERAAEQAAES